MQSPSPSFRVTTHDGQIAAAAAGKGKVANLSDLVERFKGDIDTTPAGQISGDMVAASFDIHMTQYELRQAQEMEPQNVTLNVINRPAFDNCSFFFDPTSVAGGTARACCVVSADQVEQIKKNGWLPLSIAFYDHSTPKCTLPIIEASSSSPTDAMNPVAVVNGGGTIVAASAGAAPGEVHGPNLPSAGGASETSQSAGKLDEEIRQCDCTGVHRSKCPAQLPMELPKIDTKSMASAAEQIVQWFEVGVNKEKEPMFRWTMKARKHLTANPSDKQTFQTICRMYRYIRQVKKGTDPSSITENYTTLRTAAKEKKILNTAGKRSINGKTIDQYDRARALALEVLKTP